MRKIIVQTLPQSSRDGPSGSSGRTAAVVLESESRS